MKVANFLLSMKEKTNFERIYVSPLMRALQTAERISDALNLPVRVNTGLGDFAAQTAYMLTNKGIKLPFVSIKDIAKRCPLAKLDKIHDREQTDPMGALRSIVESTKGDVLIVAHRECIRDLLCPEDAAKTHLPYCSVGLFTYKNKIWKPVRIFKQVVE